MSRKNIIALLLLVIGIFAGLAAERIEVPPEPAVGPQYARVASVTDGDTIEVDLSGRRETVRYIGIDTPELGRGIEEDECFGEEARKRNEELVLGRDVRLERDVSERDRYGRLLRHVYANGESVNARLVREGYANSATFPPDVSRSEELRALEREAREAGRGLWSSCAADEPAVPAPAATGPEGCDIKGNVSLSGERIFHVRSCEYYDRTRIDEAKGEKWFCSEDEALAAGWRKAGNCP